jgi:acylphosphatase
VTRTIVTLSGRVQGVGFRYTVLRIAKRYAVAGTVRNLRAGERVEIDAEGEADVVDAFVRSILEQPPHGARIANVERRGAEPRLLGTFSEAPTV